MLGATGPVPSSDTVEGPTLPSDSFLSRTLAGAGGWNSAVGLLATKPSIAVEVDVSVTVPVVVAVSVTVSVPVRVPVPWPVTVPDTTAEAVPVPVPVEVTVVVAVSDPVTVAVRGAVKIADTVPVGNVTRRVPVAVLATVSVSVLE
jgi:hypothetical protein